MRELERILHDAVESARTRALAAVSAVPAGFDPASAAASGNSVRSPRIAAARKRSVDSIGRRARRVETPYETAHADPNSSDLRSMLCGRLKSLLRDCVEQRHQVERIPARASLECGRELRCRFAAEPLACKDCRRLLT